MQYLSLELEYVVGCEMLSMRKRSAERFEYDGRCSCPTSGGCPANLEGAAEREALDAGALDNKHEPFAAIEDRGQRTLDAGKQKILGNRHRFANDDDEHDRAPRCNDRTLESK